MVPLIMSGSVGVRGQNSSNDVYLIKALLNAWARLTSQTELSMTDSVDATMQTLIEDFQRKVVKMGKPDGLVSVNLGTFKALVNELRSSFSRAAITPPANGKVTWEAEGTEGGRYHSRILHVPSSNSGLTIGRGYDMKQKTAAGIISDLTQANVDSALAAKLSAAAGLAGKSAERFVVKNDLLDLEISPSVQLSLFKRVYASHLADVKRISGKSATVSAYGKVDWLRLPKEMVDVVVDLRYRGDYTPSSRKLIQSYLATCNFSEFKRVIQSQANWAQVPYARFKLRAQHLNTMTAIQPVLTGVTP